MPNDPRPSAAPPAATDPSARRALLRELAKRRAIRRRRLRPTHALPTLETEIRGWEPYSADWSLVVVDVVATLADPQDGRTIWSVERTDWRIPTRDARSSREASISIVARPGLQTTGASASRYSPGIIGSGPLNGSGRGR